MKTSKKINILVIITFCIFLNLNAKSKLYDSYKFINTVLKSENVIIGELSYNYKVNIIKVVRDEKEIVRCKALAEELVEKLNIYKKNQKKPKESKDNIETTTKFYQKRIDFYNSKSYYSYRTDLIIVERLKGKLEIGSKVIVEIGRSIEMEEAEKVINLKRGSLEEKNLFYFTILGQYIKGPSEQYFDYDAIERTDFNENLTLVDLKSNINGGILPNLVEIEFLITHVNSLNEKGIKELNNYNIFKDEKIEVFSEIWSKCKKDFIYKDEDFEIKDIDLLNLNKQMYLKIEEPQK